MRLLNTADWHVGKQIRDNSRVGVPGGQDHPTDEAAFERCNALIGRTIDAG